ncbi:hypothetical protein LXA43DRAFT_1025605 [Ganoderma leucocontextum]|nr:hypothetical protein LXA43DRAFT_1025605 [Ganoderma leucocontextum]
MPCGVLSFSIAALLRDSTLCCVLPRPHSVRVALGGFWLCARVLVRACAAILAALQRAAAARGRREGSIGLSI